jgi:electron transfer flavoprotein beta subunit
MKILVTIKRITDPNVRIRLLPDGSGIDTSNVEYKINPFDEYALEQALRIREANPDKIDEVIVVSVGDGAATKELRISMAMGADRGILVECDDSEYDASVVAELLQKVVEMEQPGIVMMGKVAADGENNQVAQMLASRLGYGQGTFAVSVTLQDNSVLLETQADGGVRHIEVTLPAVVTRADMPDEDVRYASLPGIMKAKRKELKIVTPSELGVEPNPRIKILGYSLPPERASGQIVESVEALVDKLHNEAKVV